MSNNNRNLFADISSNNAGFNAAMYASAGYGAVAIKATEGSGFVNPEHATWCRDAHRHNLAVIHYHFARPENGDPRGQAEHFWDAVKPHVRRPGDYLFWDVETDSPQTAGSWLREADGHLRSVSEWQPGAYMPLSFYQAGLRIRTGRYWIAAWGPNRPGNWQWKLSRNDTLFAWQRSDGRVGSGPTEFAGIPGHCDSNILNPSEARYLLKVRRAK